MAFYRSYSTVHCDTTVYLSIKTHLYPTPGGFPGEKELKNMDFRTFINTYFKEWAIVGTTSCGTSHGVLKLCSHKTFIKVHFKLNGDNHWTDPNVRADYIEAIDTFGL